MPTDLEPDRLKVDLPLSRLKTIGAEFERDIDLPIVEQIERYMELFSRVLEMLPDHRQPTVQEDFNRAVLGLLVWYHTIVGEELPRGQAMTDFVGTILARQRRRQP